MKTPQTKLGEKYSHALKIQALYALLCIVWNGVVIGQVQIGVQPIGPTGSTAVIAGAVILVVLLAYCLHAGWEAVYIVLSALIFSLAFSAVWSSVTASSEAWPSEFWQMAGLSINVIGVTSFIVVVVLFVRGRNKSPAAND